MTNPVSIPAQVPGPRTRKNQVRLLGRCSIPAVLVMLVGFVLLPSCSRKPSDPRSAGQPGTYLFCSWNVENFFDDHDDAAIHDDMEDYFGRNPEAFKLKVNHLADALLTMNDGVGPDIMALYEVESQHCLEALQEALNSRLNAAGKSDRKYEHILFIPDHTGRHFAPGIITRLPVDANRTQKINKHNGRILEGHVDVAGHDLVVIAAHWTSRLSRPGKGGDNNESRRLSYANDCYGRFRAILTANPDADVILCGDYNDEFKDDAIQTGLHASDSADTVRNALHEPRPLALLAHWPANSDPPGSIYGRGHWSIFDQILFSRGLLDDKGWQGDPASVNIFAPELLRKKVSKNRYEPFRFGDAKENGPRGYSDHFPVTVRLSVK